MNKPNLYNVTKIERLSSGILKIYNQSNLIAIFSALKSVNIYRENGKPLALTFCQDCVDPFGFTVYNLIEIVGTSTTQTYSEIDPTTSNDDYASRIYSVLDFITDQCLTGFSPQPSFVGGVVAEYPNFASFPVTGQSGVIYIDMSGPTAYVWDGAAYQSLSGAGGFVPYTGATADVDLGTYNLKADAIELSQTPTDTAGVAKMVWNDSDGTIEYKLKGGNVTLQVGQEEVVRVVNKSGVNLLESNYQAVRVRLVSEGGASGQRLAVVLAQGNNDTNSATTLGIVTENINDNQEGFITTYGLVRNIDTTGSLQGETWVDGDIIYLSPTTPGAITNVKPVAPQHMIILGYVVYAHGVNGKIFVKVDNGYELDELHNVKITTPLNRDVLEYDSTNSLWINGRPPVINFINVSDGTGVTGTTLNTLTQSILIPANSVEVGDIITVRARVRKTGVAGLLSIRSYINTSPSIGGSNMSITSVANTSLFAQFSRNFAVKTTTNTEAFPIGSQYIDDAQTGTVVVNANIDWTVDQYLIIAVQNTSAADTTRGSFIHVQINKP